jgi:RNA polymerase sigma-70 factor (ECF subfamily)
MEKQPLNALVERSKRGDTAAFEELVMQYSTDLYRIAAAMVGPDEASDMVQDAFVSAWRTLPRLRDADKWHSWLRSILMNRCRNALRTRTRRPRLVVLDPDGSAGTHESSHDPMRELDSRWEMQDALAALRPEDQAVIVLFYLADLPLPEVASVLGLRLGTVKSRLNAGLRALRAGQLEELA